jgi:putative endonuclease
MKAFAIYFITNWNHEVLYIGVTSNLEKRLWEHKNKVVDGFTEKYNVFKLVYFEQFADAETAIQREKQLKNWSRSKKDVLVNKINPQWKDLSSGWYQDPSTSLGMTIESV